MVNFMYMGKLKQKIGVVWNVRGCYIRGFMIVKEHMPARRDMQWNSVIGWCPHEICWDNAGV